MTAGKTSIPEGPARRVSFSELLGAQEAAYGSKSGAWEYMVAKHLDEWTMRSFRAERQSSSSPMSISLTSPIAQPDVWVDFR